MSLALTLATLSRNVLTIVMWPYLIAYKGIAFTIYLSIHVSAYVDQRLHDVLVAESRCRIPIYVYTTVNQHLK